MIGIGGGVFDGACAASPWARGAGKSAAGREVGGGVELGVAGGNVAGRGPRRGDFLGAAELDPPVGGGGSAMLGAAEVLALGAPPVAVGRGFLGRAEPGGPAGSLTPLGSTAIFDGPPMAPTTFATPLGSLGTAGGGPFGAAIVRRRLGRTTNKTENAQSFEVAKSVATEFVPMLYRFQC
jgi:hypothetical protein